MKSQKSQQSITMDCNFPGGNIIVDDIRGSTIRVHPDHRDTKGYWFYWYFRVRGVAGRKIKVIFKENKAFGPNGPAWSVDGATTWSWLGMDHVKVRSFVASVPPGVEDVRFCFAVPYTAAHLERFLALYLGNSHLAVKSLCKTPKGREAEILLIGKVHGRLKHKVFITARHHACETMASYVVEGVIESILGNSPEGDWFRENVAFAVVPFVDKDGVEEGDQGKNRIPWDHNRDYGETTIYAETRAIKEFLPPWFDKGSSLAFDFHCPYIHDEKIQIIGLPDKNQWTAVEAFSRVLERVQRGSLAFKVVDNLPFGNGWNTASNTPVGKDFSAWAWGLGGMRLVATVEVPYAAVSGATVNPDSARAFGKDFAQALRVFLA
nr:M14 family zinc carboxypeptidase [Candidatus Sigynarchaeota archaeon]